MKITERSNTLRKAQFEDLKLNLFQLNCLPPSFNEEPSKSRWNLLAKHVLKDNLTLMTTKAKELDALPFINFYNQELLKKISDKNTPKRIGRKSKIAYKSKIRIRRNMIKPLKKESKAIKASNLSPTSTSNSKSRSRSISNCVEADQNLFEKAYNENSIPKNFVHRLSKRDTDILKLFASRDQEIKRKRQSVVPKHIFVEPLSPPTIKESPSKQEMCEGNKKKNDLNPKSDHSNLTPSRKSVIGRNNSGNTSLSTKLSSRVQNDNSNTNIKTSENSKRPTTCARSRAQDKSLSESKRGSHTKTVTNLRKHADIKSQRKKTKKRIIFRNRKIMDSFFIKINDRGNSSESNRKSCIACHKVDISPDSKNNDIEFDLNDKVLKDFPFAQNTYRIPLNDTKQIQIDDLAKQNTEDFRTNVSPYCKKIQLPNDIIDKIRSRKSKDLNFQKKFCKESELLKKIKLNKYKENIIDSFQNFQDKLNQTSRICLSPKNKISQKLNLYKKL